MTTKKTPKTKVAKKPAKKAVKKTTKKVAKKVAKKAVAPKKKSKIGTSTVAITPEPKSSGVVIYAADIKNLSLRDRVFNWFRS